MIIAAFPSLLAMPELPEVEVTRLSFVTRIAGAKIVNVPWQSFALAVGLHP
jgi:formamidopyrimidine-DNA glycosylase